MAEFVFIAQDKNFEDVERFVLSFPGTMEQAREYVKSHNIGGENRDFTCIPLPLKPSGKPSIICQQMPQKPKTESSEDENIEDENIDESLVDNMFSTEF